MGGFSPSCDEENVGEGRLEFGEKALFMSLDTGRASLKGKVTPVVSVLPSN